MFITIGNLPNVLIMTLSFHTDIMCKNFMKQTLECKGNNRETYIIVLINCKRQLDNVGLLLYFEGWGWYPLKLRNIMMYFFLCLYTGNFHIHFFFAYELKTEKMFRCFIFTELYGFSEIPNTFQTYMYTSNQLLP